MIAVRNEIATLPFQGLQVMKLFRNEAMELLSISLDEDAVFPEHSSPTEAVLLVLEGRIRFHIEGREFALGPQEFLSFPAKTPHWVQAEKPAKFLIMR